MKAVADISSIVRQRSESVSTVMLSPPPEVLVTTSEVVILQDSGHFACGAARDDALGCKGCGISSSLTADEHTISESACKTTDLSAKKQIEAHSALMIVPFVYSTPHFRPLFCTLRRQ